jgi:excisionase family DNA binding protein
LLRAAEVARVLGVGRSKAYELMSNGDLPVVRMGRVVRVPSDELVAWIRSRTMRPGLRLVV